MSPRTASDSVLPIGTFQTFCVAGTEYSSQPLYPSDSLVATSRTKKFVPTFHTFCVSSSFTSTQPSLPSFAHQKKVPSRSYGFEPRYPLLTRSQFSTAAALVSSSPALQPKPSASSRGYAHLMSSMSGRWASRSRSSFQPTSKASSYSLRTCFTPSLSRLTLSRTRNSSLSLVPRPERCVKSYLLPNMAS